MSGTSILLVGILVIGIIAIVRSRGEDLAGWGVALLAIVGLGVL